MKPVKIVFCIECEHFDMRIEEGGPGMCKKGELSVLLETYWGCTGNKYRPCSGEALDARLQLLDLIKAAL